MRLHRGRRGRLARTWVSAVLLVVLLGVPLARAQTYTFNDADASWEPFKCWTNTFEFYSSRFYPYYDFEGYPFNANPWAVYRWMDMGHLTAMAKSSMGTDLKDMMGVVIWRNAELMVGCYKVTYWYSPVGHYMAKVLREYGTLEDVNLACSGGGSTTYSLLTYDPYDEYSTYTNCAPGTGTHSGDNGGMSCTPEYLVVEISNDGGSTWSTWWEGYALVCT